MKKRVFTILTGLLVLGALVGCDGAEASSQIIEETKYVDVTADSIY